MKVQIVSALVVGVALAGCERVSQELPFSVDDVVGRTIATGGGTVSTPAGASVEFPAGSVAGPVEVTLAVVPPPAETRASGVAVSDAYRLEPAGYALAAPALAELRFSGASDPARAWLASVVSVAGGRVVEHGNTRVDLSTGLAAAPISELATLSVVIPPADAVFPVTRTGASFARLALPAAPLAATGADSVTVHCGEPGNRCVGLVVSASGNLMDRVEDAAAVYPVIDGRLAVDGTTASDSILLRASIRAQLESGQTAENLEIRALVRPTPATVVTETASEIRMTNVIFRVSGEAEAESESHEEVATLVIPRSADGGTISVSRTFRLRNAGGDLEDATVSVTFPVEIHP